MYLQFVYEIEEDEYGMLGWVYVVGEYVNLEYKNFLEDFCWEKLIFKVLG